MTASKEAFDAIFAAIPDAVLFADTCRTIMAVNPAFSRLFGYRPEEVLGKDLADFGLDRELPVEWLGRLEEPQASASCESFDANYHHKNGTVFTGETTWSLVHDAGGKLLGMLSVIRNISPVRASERKFRTFLESAPMGIMIVGEQGKINLVNAEVERLFDYPRDQLVGQQVEILLPPRLGEVHTRHRADYLKKPYFRSMGIGMDLVGRAKSGREFPVEISLNSIQVNGETWSICFIVDITKAKEAEAQLAEYAEELKAQNVELDAFAHTVAHDLKTPVALVLGYAEMLKQYGDPSAQGVMSEAVNQIVSTGHRINSIISELILLASVRKFDVEMVPLDMFAIVEEVQKRLSFMLKEYRANIVLPYTWPVAVGYGPWIQEVWANYISNALKYGGTPPRVELGATAQADGMVRFWVKDNGEGIAKQDQEAIFTPFSQLSQVSAQGHGLGLSIVQRIVDKCLGQVGVDSKPGAGSSFWFTLPAAK